MAEIDNTVNKTTEFISKISHMWSLFGVQNLWIKNVFDTKFIKYINVIGTFCIIIMIALEVSALFTQTNLNEKQRTDILILMSSHTLISSSFLAPQYYKEEIRQLLITLCVTLKNVYNDQEIEQRMLKRAGFFCVAFMLTIFVTLLSYAIDGLLQAILADGTFTTIIIGWPDIEDASFESNLFRFIVYLFVWIYMAKIIVGYTLAIFTTVAVSHQLTNLQSYFYKLNDIFDDESEETLSEKEMKYEKSLKVGIKLHSQTLWCTEQCQKTCSIIISAQILLYSYIFALLILQLVKTERSLVTILVNVSTASNVLITLGFLMLNAGNITTEAALLPNAMYSSGWQHCRGETSKRVRTLLTLAMAQGQSPVVIRSFYMIDISYESFLTIVKSSYSAFSLLY